MKNIHFLLLIVLILFCSCRKSNLKQISSFEGDTLMAKAIIDTTITQIISELREETIKLGTNDIPIDSLIISVIFDNHNGNKAFFGTDSVVYISFLAENKDYSEYVFKGILEVGKYKIAVFDIQDVGLHLYNKADLIQVNFKNLFRPELDLNLESVLKIEDDRLLQWIGP